MPKNEKWCPECGCFSDAKRFKSFRCKHCVKEKGDPTMDLPKYLTSKYIRTESGHFIPKDNVVEEVEKPKKTTKKAAKRKPEKKVVLIENRKKPRKKATKKTARKKAVKKAKKK